MSITFISFSSPWSVFSFTFLCSWFFSQSVHIVLNFLYTLYTICILNPILIILYIFVLELLSLRYCITWTLRKDSFEIILSKEHLSVSLYVKTCKQKTPNFFFPKELPPTKKPSRNNRNWPKILKWALVTNFPFWTITLLACFTITFACLADFSSQWTQGGI